MRRASTKPLLEIVPVALIVLSLASCALAQDPHKADAAMVEQWLEDVSNWGRWGDNDQLGTLNLITPEKRLAAAALVADGVSVSLAHHALTDTTPDNPSPYGHQMTAQGTDNTFPFVSDEITVDYHGYAHSHMDSLCHMFWNGKMYNGYARDTIDDAGCSQLGIQGFQQGIFTRGILMDIARLKGVDYLEPATPIYAEDLEAWEEEAGLEVSAGDVVLIRTGRWARRAEHGAWDVGTGSAGLHASAVLWLHERDVAMLGSDVASDVLPSGIEGISHPVHLLTLVARGCPIFDNLDLEAVSAAAAERNRYEFLLTAAPIAMPQGTGSPLNPIATF